MESRQRAVAEVDRLYNLWLMDEATRLGLLCIQSQPWESLADRIVATLGTHRFQRAHQKGVPHR